MTVLKVENVSKLYRLGELGTGTVSHDLNRWWAKVRGKEDPYAVVGQINDRSQKAESDYVWALKDINFEVEQGEVLGIIGRNGAGKSTLLKVLSQITSPTRGTIKTKGRIASLLEVGTGMHPEMTARENIYLNGAILGMTKKEIASKFDEIVDFSGCTMFVDTPLKRFSSGMRVRLGFAVAAFLEPEILIVDEVLAVGDAEFQKKAIGKMKDISAGGGRTVLFVSHNMASVKSLCTRTIVMENGGIEFVGSTDLSIKRYLETGPKQLDELDFQKRNKQIKSQKSLFISGFQITSEEDATISNIISGNAYKMKLHYESTEASKVKGVRLLIKDNMDSTRILLNGAFVNDLLPYTTISKTNGSFEYTIKKFPLPPGQYTIQGTIYGVSGILDEIQMISKISVEAGDFYKTGRLPQLKEGVYIDYGFSIQKGK